MKKFLAAMSMAMTVLIAGMAFAGAATDKVKAKQQQLFDVIAQKKSDARDKKLKSLFDEILDYDTFAKDSLGDKWDDISSDQKAEFSSRLTKLVRCNYKRNLKKMLDYDISYVGESNKRGATLVKTLAKHKTKEREPDIEVDFLMKGNMAVDIYTERASLTKTYRSQFKRIIKKKGWSVLIEKMDKKIAKGGCD